MDVVLRYVRFLERFWFMVVLDRNGVSFFLLVFLMQYPLYTQ